MIARIIDSSIANRFFVVLAAIGLALAGFWAVRTTPVDALPDLSDVQVVIRSNYPGQAPRIVEDQVTYPMATTMLSVPGAETVRGYSFFGDSYVYVIFEDGSHQSVVHAIITQISTSGVWSHPNTGVIRRMWQPFNGLEVYQLHYR